MEQMKKSNTKKSLNVNMIKWYEKMINFDYATKENIKQHWQNWPRVFDHSCRILEIGGCASGKKDIT